MKFAIRLTHNANVATKRRKALRPNVISQWQVRIRKYRVFYDLEGDDGVNVVAVGHKEHNDLYIRGKKVDL